MPKRSKNESAEKELESVKNRWEFLRLNKKYGEERLRAVQLGKEAREKYLIEGRSNVEAYLQAIKEVDKFYDKWEVSLDCPPPERNFNDIPEGGRWSLFKKAINMDHKMVEIIANNKNSPFHRSMFDEKNLNPLKIEINLKMPKGRILYELDNLIETIQRLMEMKKPRAIDYEHLRRVYKFVEKIRAKNKKATFLEIAKKFYKGKRDDIGREEEDLFGRHYRKAKKIVEGGYKYIW